jgi:transglutaminase-like putative cysteine protease
VLAGIGFTEMKNLDSKLLKYLLGIFAFILALHSIHLPIWITVICLLFGTWRLGILYHKLSAPPLFVLAPLTLLIGVGILFTFSGQINKTSGLSMLVVMLGLKLLETNSKRDAILLIIANYLLVGFLFLFNQSLITFAASLLATLLLSSALVQLHLKNNLPFLQLIRISGKMFLQAMPIMVLLFLLFPRSTGPLWGGTQQTNSKIGLPGLSGIIELNQTNQNALDSSVAFRAQFRDAFPPNQDLYWRGPVLWTVIGDRWEEAKPHHQLSQEKLTPLGSSYSYTVTLEPNSHKRLLMLDIPINAPLQGSLSNDYSVISNTTERERIVYQGESYSKYLLGNVKKLPRRTLRMALQIDEDANPHTIDLARKWSHLDPPVIVESALAYYKDNGFTYTLDVPKYHNDVIDQFLFESKSGFCEHFATSFVYMMRAAGVPARVVTGYQGGEKNKDYLIIRQSDAHAWAEVWLATQGWVRVDPTANISPERVSLGIADAIETTQRNDKTSAANNKNSLPINLQTKKYPALHSALLTWDGIDHQWNKSVISYHRKNQQMFLSKLANQTIKPNKMLAALIISFLLVCASTAFIICRQNRTKLNNSLKLYNHFLRILKPYYLFPARNETSMDFAIRASQYFPKQKEQLIEIAQLNNYLLYGRLSKHEKLAHYTQFKKVINQFSATMKKQKSETETTNKVFN